MEGHEHSADFWTEVWSITFDPAHMVAELVSAIIIDVLVIALMYNFVFKRFILPAMKTRLTKEIHKEIDVEHGYIHEHSDNQNQTNS